MAALMVALFHLKIGAAYFPPVQHGYLFVDLFFVLSGFVIARAYSNRLHSKGEVLAFLVRRWGRVFPLLFVASVLFVLARNAAVAANLPNAGAYEWPTWSETLTTLTLTHSMGIHHRLILNFASWSISVEFWTYVLFAGLCAAVPRRWRIPAWLAVAVFAAAVTVWASIGHASQCLTWGRCLSATFDYGYPRCVASFLLGALTWKVSGKGRSRAVAMQYVALAGIAGVFLILNAAPAAAFLLPMAFAALIWSLADDTGPVARVLGGRMGAMLGKRSYSIYLLHPVFLAAAFWSAAARAHGLESGIVLVLYLGGTLIVSGWIYRFVEAPARDWCNAVAANIEANSSRNPQLAQGSAGS